VIVSTINVNGIRAAVKQRSPENSGLLAWLKDTTADAVCLQETRADDEQLADALAPALADGWHLAAACPGAGAALKGRNGVAVLSRHPITRVLIGPEADEFASHGRYLEVDCQIPGGDLTVASVYFPTGEADTDRQLEKERFMTAVAGRMAVLNSTTFNSTALNSTTNGSRRGAVVCGDWNIAHTEADIKAWKANRKKAGFLPSERQWLTDLLASGWVDVVRVLHPGIAGPYSWWSWRGKAFDNDAGWRIDYQLASAVLAPRAIGARVERADAYALRWSDHAPVTVEYAAFDDDAGEVRDR
jgi:exodeoxyribonuclease-3